MAPGLRADDAEGKPAPARTPRVFRLTTQKRRAIQRIASGDVLQGAAADCNSAGETHAWFDSRVAHHSPKTKPTSRVASVHQGAICASARLSRASETGGGFFRDLHRCKSVAQGTYTNRTEPSKWRTGTITTSTRTRATAGSSVPSRSIWDLRWRRSSAASSRALSH